MWTEQVYNTRHLDYMMWPRGFAIAEALWSPASQRNWKGFVTRVEDQFNRFDVADKKYAPSMYEADIKVKKDAAGKLLLDFPTEIDDIRVHYSFDNSFPDNHYPSYNGTSIIVPTDATTLKIQSYRNNKPVGRIISVGIEELRKRR